MDEREFEASLKKLLGKMNRLHLGQFITVTAARSMVYFFDDFFSNKNALQFLNASFLSLGFHCVIFYKALASALTPTLVHSLDMARVFKVIQNRDRAIDPDLALALTLDHALNLTRALDLARALDFKIFQEEETRPGINVSYFDKKGKERTCKIEDILEEASLIENLAEPSIWSQLRAIARQIAVKVKLKTPLFDVEGEFDPQKSDDSL